jgi:hypothetical protein
VAQAQWSDAVNHSTNKNDDFNHRVFLPHTRILIGSSISDAFENHVSTPFFRAYYCLHLTIDPQHAQPTAAVVAVACAPPRNERAAADETAQSAVANVL